MNDAEDSNRLLFLVALLSIIAAGGIVDLALDAPESWLSGHVLFEVGYIMLCMGSAAYMWRGWYRTRRSLGRMGRALSERGAERDAWRERARKLLEGLGEAIDSQMRTWRLTDAERETALLLLKGYSHKEIAKLTGRSERTVRQHSVAVYRKSGLSGRAELSAFFLEDLLLPVQGDEAADAAGPEQGTTGSSVTAGFETESLSAARSRSSMD